MATVADKSRIPDVIRFVYDEFSVDQSKKLASAKCRKCRAVIREKQGTTSAFVRHLATAARCAPVVAEGVRIIHGISYS